MSAASAFIKQAHETVRLYAPMSINTMSINTGKAPTYKRVIADLNRDSFPGEEVIHVTRKGLNNHIESDHAALKRITDLGKGLSSLRTAKARLKGIEAIRMIKRGHAIDPSANTAGEVRLLNELFELAA